MSNPWVVSVLSTDYDLKEYRQAIISLLKEKKFDVSAFELPEFPVEHTLHSHDSCKVALQRADIALLIINKRSGGIYRGSDAEKDQVPITEAEYLDAINRGIPVFVFVNQNSFDELHGYRIDFSDYCKKNNLSLENETQIQKAQKQFDSTYKCKYVEKVDTLHFIEKVQSAYSKNDVSNWMVFFEDIDSLKMCVEGKLRGYSRALIQKLAEGQKNVLLNRHTSTSIGMSLRDVFTSEYYIEPPHKVESGKTLLDGEANELSKKIETVLSTDNSTLIYGEAGYGKTTIVAKCFVDHVDVIKNNPSYTIPLFLPLKNKGNNYKFDLKEFINEEIKDILKKDEYPYLYTEDLKLRFYCDGFDELAESLSENDIDRIRNSRIFEYPLVLTCRMQFVTRYLNTHSFSDVFGVRIKMLKWNIDTVEQYVENFCDKQGMEEEQKSGILSAIRNSKDIQQLIDSPLLVTMFLWFLEKEGMDVDISRERLFGLWMKELARREQSKNTTLETDIILKVWRFVAWNVYISRRRNEKLKKEDIIDLINQTFPDINANNVLATFDALFEWKSDYINGTFHEQFMEFLVAELLINACYEEKDPYPDFLQQVIRPEINRYFRGIWREKSRKEKEKIYDAISKQYFDNVGKMDATMIATRVHAIYHLCRLDCGNKRSDCIERAFQVEKNIAVLLSLYFGAIKLGNMEKEEEFYQLLHDQEYSNANRGYHLTYYADIIPDGSLPYKDDESSDWQGTLKAIERHFEKDDSEHFYLRRIDLFTIKELMIARKKVEPLTKEVLNTLGERIKVFECSNDQQQKALNDKIQKEYDDLVKVYNELKGQS